MSNFDIPKKPADAKWTDDQWLAMTAKGSDILVAAAAGSGKTAVLVERIIKKVIDENNPTNIDELLVVTFTEAAAAEMRHRIAEELEKSIDKNPSSTHLRKQLSLLNKASISTLHAFCQHVIRKYYYLIDIDPGFRIADQTEIQLIRDEVIIDIFEEEYSDENNESFFSLVDTFTSDRNDDALQAIILELYDFARSNDNPSDWLEKIVEMYDVEEINSVEQLPFIETVHYQIQLQLEGARSLLERALSLTKVPGGPAPRAETYLSDIAVVDSLASISKKGWDELHLAMQNVKFDRAKQCRGDDYDKDILKEAQKIRDDAKKIITDLRDKYFLRESVNLLADMKEMGAHIERIVELVNKFSERFSQIKQEKGLADFADLEHYCLEILTTSIDSKKGRQPSEAALAFKSRFKEVLVDEYQDTNMVQEAIIRLVTKGDGEKGNLFMVGDVKQSIYRFRLAEPNLFLQKYRDFKRLEDIESNKGLRIDLAQNFRSRYEVLMATNFIFKQIMGVKVGEIEYDEAASLQYGAKYPSERFPVEVCLIDQANSRNSEIQTDDEEADNSFDYNDLEQSQLEAKYIASQIKQLIKEKREIYNPKTESTRPIMYRDIVILLRSLTWAPEIMEEFKKQGIPIYAELSSGYFEATEVNIMMSLLKVIDNPYQDIPLVAVLRSPIVNLDEEQLSAIRLLDRNVAFYEALTAYLEDDSSSLDANTYEKVKNFYEQLQSWRTYSRQNSLSQLVWKLYRETQFYDYVGGLPGGKQRQANLTALYDRARQYEKTSFRGLFRFLRFVERMKERGDDLGAARAIGEQEDVVRMMTIHSSKGLEFPVVFVGALGRNFNVKDLQKPYLLDKDLGVATKYINFEKHISYDSLPQLAFKAKKELEMSAEEMRVLYVALTRAKEKLYLVATLKDLEKEIEKWQPSLMNENWLLSEYDRLTTRRFIDWIGRALVRHRNCEQLVTAEVSGDINSEIYNDSSTWKINIVSSEEIVSLNEEISEEHTVTELLSYVEKSEQVPVKSPFEKEISTKLDWNYDYEDVLSYRSKQSVSEVKRQHELLDEASSTDLISSARRPLVERPRFLQAESLTASERGTVMHALMQHIPLDKPINELLIGTILDELVMKEILTVEQSEVVDPHAVVRFFETDLGKRIVKANLIKRELPFSISLKATEVYQKFKNDDERVLIQGIIDCLFIDEDGVVLLDYKTDNITDRFKGNFEKAAAVLSDRYKVQIELYSKALEQILQREVTERYLYFFDGSHLLKM